MSTPTSLVEVSAGAARKLNLLHSSDPHYRAERKNYQSTGEMRVIGAISPAKQLAGCRARSDR